MSLSSFLLNICTFEGPLLLQSYQEVRYLHGKLVTIWNVSINKIFTAEWLRAPVLRIWVLQFIDN